MNRRIWVVGGLVAVGAVTLALVAGLAASSHSEAKKTFIVAKADSESLADKAGIPNEGPEATYEAEQAALRAYPADAVPLEATLNAQETFKKFKKHGKKVGQWRSIGPTQAKYPAELNPFLFDGAPFTASGRVTAMAISPTCTERRCTLFVAAAGGGVWRTDRALEQGNQKWEFLSGDFGTNAIGTLTIDAGDPSGNTIYAGTGEPNASADSEAGVGIYKSTDGGGTWTKLAGNTTVAAGTVDCTPVFGAFGVQTAPAYSGPAFTGRAISSIVVQGNTIYVGSTRAVRGVASASSGGAVSLAPGLPPYGLFKSTDGGATFTLLNAETICLNPTLAGGAGIVQASFGSTRGVNEVAADPSDANTIYAAAFPRNNSTPLNTGGGVWRSMDAGATWTQIKSSLNPNQNTDRSTFAVNTLPNGKTRMYVGIGSALATEPDRGSLFRTDDATAASPSFANITSPANIGYCGYSAGGQCWYDNVVYSPAGAPDVVYVGGSFDYDRVHARNNGRAWMLSPDAGATFYDLTQDADAENAEAIHPDQHAIVTVPGNPWQFIVGSDGGVTRSDGNFADVSYKCDSRGLGALSLGICHTMLSHVPHQLIQMNKDLSTLQFQSFSLSPDANKLMGGTQDNGTFQFNGSAEVWPQIIYGDGGQSGFNAANSELRFNTFTGQANDVNFRDGDPLYWVIATGPIVASPESAMFYPPIIADPNPATAGSIFQGSRHVWRTQDWGGNQAYLEANCPEFTTSAANVACGDFVPLSGPAGNNNNAGDLEGTAFGDDRTGGNIAAIERAPSNTGTLWAATTTGRLFISDNANAAGANTVTWTRLDSTATNDPGRFISSIYVDPANPNHAWVSYSSYSSLTPAQPGHVFEVTRLSGAATWTDRTYNLSDLPVTDLVLDGPTGDLYAATDFGVFTLKSGATTWSMTAGLPMVEVAGLTISADTRVLYAATHGLGGWAFGLPKVKH